MSGKRKPDGDWPLRPKADPSKRRVLAAALIEAGATVSGRVAEQARLVGIEPSPDWLRDIYLPQQLWGIEMRLLQNLRNEAGSPRRSEELDRVMSQGVV